MINFEVLYLEEGSSFIESMNEKALVVCTHGIVKKTQKTPKKEIKKAEQIRKQYLEL